MKRPDPNIYSMPATSDDIILYGKAVKRPIIIDKAVIAYFQEKFGQLDPDFKTGYAMTSFIWFNIAKKVVESAISVYKCTPEQAEALKRVYLRSGDYTVSDGQTN